MWLQECTVWQCLFGKNRNDQMKYDAEPADFHCSTVQGLRVCRNSLLYRDIQYRSDSSNTDVSGRLLYKKNCTTASFIVCDLSAVPSGGRREMLF